MAEQLQRTKQQHTEPAEITQQHPAPGAQVNIATADVDDLLEEIDGVLEEEAEEFVSNFVQKGGE